MTGLRRCVLLLAGGAVFLAGGTAQAQRDTTVERTDSGYVVRYATPGGMVTSYYPSARELLAGFAVAGSHPRLGNVLFRPDLFGQTVADSIADGLEDLAVYGRDQQIRVAAVSTLYWLSHAALNPTERLIRIYDRSGDEVVQSSVIGLMVRAANPRLAIQFLRTVAVREPRATDREDAPSLALWTLSGTPEGRAVLRELHARSSVPSAAGRETLEWLTRNDFGLPPSAPDP
jgi:hypothetical protein